MDPQPLEEPEHPATDERLIERFASAGDRASLDELARRHQDRAYNLALRILGNTEDAQDAVQDAWLCLVRYARTFDARRPFKVWFATIAINSARRVAKQKKRKEWPRETLSSARETSPPMSQREETMELQDQALASVAALPEHYRLPVVLRYLQGMDVRETAEALGLPESTTRTRLKRALGKIRARLQRLGLAAGVGSVEVALQDAPCEAAPDALRTALHQITQKAVPHDVPGTRPLRLAQRFPAQVAVAAIAVATTCAAVAWLLLSQARDTRHEPIHRPVRVAGAAPPKKAPQTDHPKPSDVNDERNVKGVWIELGEQNVERGLKLVKPQWADTGVPETINGRQCRRSHSPHGLCLDIDDSYIFNGNCPGVSVFVDYLDRGHDRWGLHYDSLDHSAQWNGTLKRCKEVQKTDSGEWRTACYQITDARFSNQTFGKGDLLIASYKFRGGQEHDECFARVRVTKESLTLSTDRRFVMAGQPREAAVCAKATDAAGNPVADGTRISFQSSEGSIAPSAPTESGKAITVLTTPGHAGNLKVVAKVRAMEAMASLPVIGGAGDAMEVTVPLGWFEMGDAIRPDVLGADAEINYKLEAATDRRTGRLDYTLPSLGPRFSTLVLRSRTPVPGFLHKFEIDILGNGSNLAVCLTTRDATNERLSYILCPALGFTGWRTTNTPLTSPSSSGDGNNDHRLDYPLTITRVHMEQYGGEQAGSGVLRFANPRLHTTVAESRSVWVEIGSPLLVSMRELGDDHISVPVRLVNLIEVERKLGLIVALEKDQQTVEVLGEEDLALGGREAHTIDLTCDLEATGQYTIVAEATGGIIEVEVRRPLTAAE